jgi:hypothetical protein
MRRATVSISNVNASISRRSDPTRGGEGAVQAHPVQQGLPGDPEQVADRHAHALLGQHRVHLRLEPGAQRDQFGPLCRGSGYAEGWWGGWLGPACRVGTSA